MTTPLRHLALVARGIEPVALTRHGQGGASVVAQATTYPKGRECIYHCGTVLNRYNPGPACLCHTARYEREIDQAIAA